MQTTNSGSSTTQKYIEKDSGTVIQVVNEKEKLCERGEKSLKGIRWLLYYCGCKHRDKASEVNVVEKSETHVEVTGKFHQSKVEKIKSRLNELKLKIKICEQKNGKEAVDEDPELEKLLQEQMELELKLDQLLCSNSKITNVFTQAVKGR